MARSDPPEPSGFFADDRYADYTYPRSFREDPRYADNFKDDPEDAPAEVPSEVTSEDLAEDRYTDYAPAQSFRDDPRYASNFADEPARHAASTEDPAPTAFYADIPDDAPEINGWSSHADGHIDADARYPEYIAAQSFREDPRYADNFTADNFTADNVTETATFRDDDFGDDLTPPRGFDPFNEATYFPPPVPWYRTTKAMLASAAIGLGVVALLVSAVLLVANRSSSPSDKPSEITPSISGDSTSGSTGAPSPKPPPPPPSPPPPPPPPPASAEQRSGGGGGNYYPPRRGNSETRPAPVPQTRGPDISVRPSHRPAFPGQPGER